MYKWTDKISLNYSLKYFMNKFVENRVLVQTESMQLKKQMLPTSVSGLPGSALCFQLLY